MKYLTLDEIHAEERNMLKIVIDFFEKNNIVYYICGGTMLGAVRHKGFIPWDDDIDLFLPRPEFEKFERCAEKSNFYLAENIKLLAYDMGSMDVPFAKVENTQLKLSKDCLETNTQPYLWVDIFPMDGLPESDKETEKLYKKVIKLRRLFLALNANSLYLDNYSTSRAKKILKKILRVFANKKIKERVANKLDKLSKTYSYNDSKYVGCIVWGYGPCEKLLKSDVNSKEFEFEGLKVNGLECYDKYLSNLYGDYMKLPPVEKRKSHNLKVYREN